MFLVWNPTKQDQINKQNLAFKLQKNINKM